MNFAKENSISILIVKKIIMKYILKKKDKYKSFFFEMIQFQ